MSVRFVTLVTVVSLSLVALAIVPAASGTHCGTKISVYSRASMSPQPAPPYSITTSNTCVQLAEGTPADGYTLPPGADQLFVRINGDFGPSVTTLRIELTGLGFDHSSITLNRTPSSVNGFSYDMREWIFVPAPAIGGSVSVTAFYPSTSQTATYRVAANPVTP